MMVHIIDQDKCTRCGTCISVCPERFSAITKVSGETIEVPDEPIPVTAARPGAKKEEGAAAESEE